MKRFILPLISTTLLGFTQINKAHSCMHPYRSPQAASTIKQSSQQALILHHNGIEDLFLKVDYEGTGLKEIGWVIPVPNIPDKYAVTENSLFQDLYDWTDLKRVYSMPKGARGARSGGSEPSEISPLTLLPNTKVGPFEIQPLQARGANAVTALNQWMKEHHFTTFEATQLQYYIDRDWTFLAVRIVPENGDVLDSSGSIPPLHIQFESKEAIYPLKFSTHMGEFSSQITLITAEKIPESDFDGVRCKGFEVLNDGQHQSSFLINRGSLKGQEAFALTEAPKSLQSLLQASFPNINEFHTSILLNERINQEHREIVADRYRFCSNLPSQWTEEFAIPPLPEKNIEEAKTKTPISNQGQADKKTAAPKEKTGCSASPIKSSIVLFLLSIGLIRRRASEK